MTFRIGDKIEDIVRELIGGIKPKAIAIKIKDIYLIGSPDIVYKKKYIIECKSIKKEAYLELKEPLPRHIMQLQFYLWLASKYPSLGYSEKGAIIYVPKQECDPLFKVFAFERDKSMSDKFERIVRKIKKFLKDGTLPGKCCPDIHAGVRQKCPVVKLCFTKE